METPLPSVPPVPPDPSVLPVTSAAISSEDRILGTAAHLITFISAFIGPLIIYLVKKDESAFVAEQAKEVLNFQLSALIYFFAALLSVLVLIGAVLLPALGLFVFIVTIIGAIRAYDGRLYRYPLCIRFIK